MEDCVWKRIEDFLIVVDDLEQRRRACESLRDVDLEHRSSIDFNQLQLIRKQLSLLYLEKLIEFCCECQSECKSEKSKSSIAQQLLSKFNQSNDNDFGEFELSSKDVETMMNDVCCDHSLIAAVNVVIACGVGAHACDIPMLSQNNVNTTVALFEWLELAPLHVAVLCLRLDWIERLASNGARCLAGHATRLRLTPLDICQMLQSPSNSATHTVQLYDDGRVTTLDAQQFHQHFDAQFSRRPLCDLSYFHSLLDQQRFSMPNNVTTAIESLIPTKDVVDKLNRLRFDHKTIDSHLVVAHISESLGYGVFTRTTIESGDYIACYFGNVVKVPENEDERLAKCYAMGS
jgi:hypothetical protein